jgi:excinuclease ABC subunit B
MLNQETRSIKEAVSETERRRKIQEAYNQQHGITPRSASSKLRQTVEQVEDQFAIATMVAEAGAEYTIPTDPAQQQSLLGSLRQEMFQAASKQEYERAAQLRDQINAIQDLLLKL